MVERLHSGIRLVPVPHSLATLRSQEGWEARHRQPEDTARDGHWMHPWGERTWQNGCNAADGILDTGSALLPSQADPMQTKQGFVRQSGNVADAVNGADYIAAVREPDAAEGTQGRRLTPDEMPHTAQARSYWHTILLVRHPS